MTMEHVKQHIPIFVYGTLLHGNYNYDKFLKGKVKHNETGRIHSYSLYQFTAYSYPGIFTSGSKSTVHGELMFIQPELYYETLSVLDHLEQIEEYFIRKKVNVEKKDGTFETAWVYECINHEEPKSKILSGNYRHPAIT